MSAFDYHKHLDAIAQRDVEYVRRKDKAYASSWKRRGGRGAWFTIVRPWDRLENTVQNGAQHDVFAAIASEIDKFDEGPDGTVIACVRDLRRYLLLLEAEMMERRAPANFARGGMVPTAIGMTLDNIVSRLNKAELKIHEAPPNSDPNYRPGTPEDGGHHANMFPWVYYRDNITDGKDLLWDQSGRLEPRISPAMIKALEPLSIPFKAIAGLYRPVYVNELHETSDNTFVRNYRDTPWYEGDQPVAYWLSISMCPESEREHYRVLPTEQNLKESEALMEYVELYSWVSDRYVLRRRSWARL